MVELRSGARTDPAGAAGEVPSQIEIGTTHTPVDQGAEQQATPQIYIAGSAARTIRRSPSVPRNFRPSQFAFIQQPDFQSAREPSAVAQQTEDDDQHTLMGSPNQGERRAVAGPVVFQAPMRPLDVSRNMYLDYTNTQAIKFYHKGCEKLPGDQFKGKQLLTWLVQVQDKAIRFTWIPILTINGKLLTQQFSELTMEQVREHSQVYQNKGKREAQNAEMLISCLKSSISREVYNKVYLQSEKYTITRHPSKEHVEDGVCFLKTIIDNYHSNTRSSTKQIRKQLAQLSYYMRNVAKGDVSQLCEHTRELIYELNAAGETTNDLLANLIEALKQAPDMNFQRWLNNQVDLWSMRKIDWKEDGSDLMEEAEVYYQEALTTHRWGKRSKPEVTYAFKAMDSLPETEEEVEKPKHTYEDTIKDLTEQLKQYASAYTAQWSGSNQRDSMDKKYAWKRIPPKDNDPSVKRVHMNGVSKTYYWCPNHVQWTIHKPAECKRLKPGKRTTKGFDKKAKKRSDFKARKEAFIQAKAAYEACMKGGTDEEGSSISDNDEDSNKSLSSYSSEGSNLS